MVRTVWVASLLEVGTLKGGVVFDERGDPKSPKGMDDICK